MPPDSGTIGKQDDGRLSDSGQRKRSWRAGRREGLGSVERAEDEMESVLAITATDITKQVARRRF